MAMIHPGSIQARVGSCLHMIEVNIEQTDHVGLWNFIRVLQTYSRVYLQREKDLQNRLLALDPHPLDQPDDKGFDNMMERIEICLEALHRHNLYGYHAETVKESPLLEEEEILA